MKRRPTTQDLSWFLDLHAKKQLDLDPPYQRRAVWTLKDRRFFLDTVLRNYPTGPIFLHKTTDDQGIGTYHVVDGKQRLQTIIMFSSDDVRAPTEFGDKNIDNRLFSKLSPETRERFWNYVLTVEFLDAVDSSLVNEVFDRLNRNSRRLTRQELRHARFDGQFATKMEAEADAPVWGVTGISTRARSRRMRDVEFVAELFLLTMHGPQATTADRLDDQFAEYDEEIPDVEEHAVRFEWAKEQVRVVNESLPLSGTRYKNFADFYSLFGAILELHPSPLDGAKTAENLKAFADRLEQPDADDDEANEYARAIRGASNDKKERTDRIKMVRTLIEKK